MHDTHTLRCCVMLYVLHILPELSLLKCLPLIYHRNHFLAATFDFTSFFILIFLEAAPYFYSLGGFD